MSIQVLAKSSRKIYFISIYMKQAASLFQTCSGENISNNQNIIELAHIVNSVSKQLKAYPALVVSKKQNSP